MPKEDHPDGETLLPKAQELARCRGREGHSRQREEVGGFGRPAAFMSKAAQVRTRHQLEPEGWGCVRGGRAEVGRRDASWRSLVEPSIPAPGHRGCATLLLPRGWVSAAHSGGGGLEVGWGGSSCPRPWRQWGSVSARLAAHVPSPGPGQSIILGRSGLIPLLPPPSLSSLASPRSGTDVPLSRNSSYLVNQSLEGVSDKAIWFSAEPVRGRSENKQLPPLPSWSPGAWGTP